MTHVELRDVTKTYGGGVAVNGLSMQVNKGEFFTLLGPSGCGKTTTLRLVAGFIKPDSGEVRIRGELVNEKPAHMRSTAMVFQSYALFPHMTVYDNVAFGLKMRNTSKQDISVRVRKALELVRLPGYGDRYPRQLSGGEQQRIALARAIVTEPDVLLLDEPLSNLDFKLRQAMRLEIKRLQKTLRMTTIYVTHDQGEALTMSDRILVMSRGKVMRVGGPTDIYEYPGSKFVADFIGEANFFTARIVKIDESMTELLTDGALMFNASLAGIPEQTRKMLREDMEVTLSIRPEKVRVTDSRASKSKSSENVFTGEVENMAYLGSLIKYYVRLDSGHVLHSEQPNVSGVSYSIGDKVCVQASPQSCIIILE